MIPTLLGIIEIIKSNDSMIPNPKVGLSDCEILLPSQLYDATYHDYDNYHDVTTLHASIALYVYNFV